MCIHLDYIDIQIWDIVWDLQGRAHSFILLHPFVFN